MSQQTQTYSSLHTTISMDLLLSKNFLQTEEYKSVTLEYQMLYVGGKIFVVMFSNSFQAETYVHKHKLKKLIILL
jgi:hypothetical protein